MIVIFLPRWPSGEGAGFSFVSFACRIYDHSIKHISSRVHHAQDLVSFPCQINNHDLAGISQAGQGYRIGGAGRYDETVVMTPMEIFRKQSLSGRKDSFAQNAHLSSMHMP